MAVPASIRLWVTERRQAAARAPGPWGAEQALEFAQGLMVRFYDIAAISKELERLEGRMGSVLQAYLYDRYQGDPEYDSGSKPGPRALARLQQIGPVMGNTRLSSGQVREALGYESSGGPPSLERLKANCDRLREESQFLAEMYPEQAAELEVVRYKVCKQTRKERGLKTPEVI